jgi:hypothetical protein
LSISLYSDYDFDKKIKYVAVKELQISRNKYIASNAYGAQIEVTKERINYYGICFVNDQNSKDYENIKQIEISLAPDEAKELKDNCGVLFVVKLYPSGTPLTLAREIWYHKEPKYSSPYDITGYKNLINANIISVWVYNIKTGKVYLKKDIKNTN